MGGSTGTPIMGASSSKPYLYTLLCCHGKLNGSYLTILYMLTKLFYLVNSIAQIFILNIFLGFNYNSHGAYVLIDLFKNMFSSASRIQQSQRMRQQDDAAAAQFAAKLNLNSHGGGMPPQAPIMGPTVIFDSFDNDDNPSFASSMGGMGGLGVGGSMPSVNPSIYESIYSESSVNSPLHR